MNYDRMFWMVWRKDGGVPTCQHTSLKSAMDEAERLARMNPGKEFVVLEAIKVCYVNDPVQWHQLEDTHFAWTNVELADEGEQGKP
jgi:hypothetical protein